MSTNIRERTTLRKNAPIFAALGDATRLALVLKLSTGTPLSIAKLTEGFTLSRQAVTNTCKFWKKWGWCGRSGAGEKTCLNSRRNRSTKYGGRSIESRGSGMRHWKA